MIRTFGSPQEDLLTSEARTLLLMYSSRRHPTSLRHSLVSPRWFECMAARRPTPVNTRSRSSLCRAPHATGEVDFWFSSPLGMKQLVHGTFMTAASWRIRTGKGREMFVTLDVMRETMLHVAVLPSSTDRRGHVLPDVYKMGPWQRLEFDNVKLETRMLTSSVLTPTWQVNATSKPIYGLVPPLINSTHVHNLWDEEQKRLDVSINGIFPLPDAHGIVGQSYRDSTVRNGKLDEYAIDQRDGSNLAPQAINSDGILPPMTTSAQAEGAIEGVYTDYKLSTPTSTNFKFSHFDHIPAARMGGKGMRKASTSEWDGEPSWYGAERESSDVTMSVRAEASLIRP